MPTSYKIKIKRSAEKEIESLPSEVRLRVIKAILGLADEPRPQGCEKLSGRDAYRIRIRQYRVIYSVLDDLLIIEIVRVAHRREVYR